jgi:hypothetical protein
MQILCRRPARVIKNWWKKWRINAEFGRVRFVTSGLMPEVRPNWRNARYLERTLADMGTLDDVARHIAPLGWEHIALTGGHTWERDDRPGPDHLRPLRIAPSLLAA